jgi:ribosome-binding protein aMBF1 (putative translation factor)
MGRLDFDPMARPAPIACTDAPRRRPEEAPAPNPNAKPAIASFASLTPEQRSRGGLKGNNKASTLPHNWPKVIEAILAKTGWTAKTLAEKLDVVPSTVSCWRSRKFVPIVGKDLQVVAIYRQHVGGPLP